MDSKKRKRLESSGWTIGSTEDFLELSPEEAAFLDLKLSLSRILKQQRTDQSISQSLLAKRIGSSQSRIAKAEACDHAISMDLMFRAIFATGMNRKDLAKKMKMG